MIGIDLIFIPEIGAGRAFPALSIVDWGSNYQMVERGPEKIPEVIWKTMWNIWIRVFGLVNLIIYDVGKEFSQKLMMMAVEHGVVTYQIAVRAPWQQGKIERYGAH